METVHLEEGYPVHLLETLLAMSEGSVGSNQYRYLYIDHPDGAKDVIFNGDLACAFFTSSILTLCNLIKCVHTTVDETLKDLKKFGWLLSDTPCAGAVVVWGHKLSTSDRIMHRHIGICLNATEAVSTIAAMRSPQKHGIWDLKTHTGEARKVQFYYVHPDLIK